MFLKPSPPMCFSFDMSSQATQHVLCLPSLLPHQKSRRTPSICLYNRLKHDIEYVGMACATALISTSFPPAERLSSIHPWTFRQTLSLPETLSLPSARIFAECILSDTRQRSWHKNTRQNNCTQQKSQKKHSAKPGTRQPSKKTLGKARHSAKIYFCRA